MKPTGRHPRGYSLIEMLVVMVIVGILAVAGIVYLGNRPAAGVRQVLDELEGTLLDAQKVAISTGRDVTLGTAGNWTTANPMVLVRGDATIPPGDWTAVLAAAQSGAWPPAQGGMSVAQYTTVGLGFRLAASAGSLSREHLHAGIDSSAGGTWWSTAQGSSDSVTSVAPFNSLPGFSGALTGANLLFTNAPNTGYSISGTNKRFNRTFWIPVVSISNGNAVPGGPMGLIFVQQNGGTVYKFYNPGSNNGDGHWRRI